MGAPPRPERERERPAAGELAGDRRLGLGPADRPAQARDLAPQVERVAGADDPLEADVVDAREEGEPAGEVGMARPQTAPT